MTKRTYRMSVKALAIRLVIPLVAVLIYSLFTPRPVFTLAMLGIPFALAAILLWSAYTLNFDENTVTLRKWFFASHRVYKLSELRAARLRSEKDLYASEPWIALTFSNGDTIPLMSFDAADVREILHRVEAVAPDAINSTLRAAYNL